MAIIADDIAIADRIEGLKQPFETDRLYGQQAAEDDFIRAANSNRLHHAWLLSGPRGIGKASFAFRVARFFLEAAGDNQTLSAQALEQANDRHSATFQRIANGAHPNLLHLRIPYDSAAKKFRTQLTVDEMRRTVSFFGSTAGGSGWRVAIVDRANDMNTQAANALLKILEEPPARTLFFLISDQPNRLLPTLRSRCRTLSFGRLEVAALSLALEQASPGVSLETALLRDYEEIIGGSVRRAFQFAREGIPELHQTFQTLLGQAPNYDMALLHRFADVISARGAEEKFGFFVDFMETDLTHKVHSGAPKPILVSYAEVWDKVHARLDLEDSLNLDRKQTVLALFHDLCGTI